MNVYSLPKSVSDLAESLASLPGIGPKMAGRLAVYMATKGTNSAKKIRKSVDDVITNVELCSRCGNLAEGSICSICSDEERSTPILFVVESPNDLLQIELAGVHDGSYVVLNGLISPVNGIGPEDINMEKLQLKLDENVAISEVVVALSPTVEGEATALYLLNLLNSSHPKLKLTKLGKGLPTGSEIEYLDSDTIKSAFNNRVELL